MKKKVCFLVTEHPFLDARIFKKEAKSLLNRGYHVTMIVPRINGYLFDIDGTKFKNQFLSQTFTYEGINIITYEKIHWENNIKKLNYNIQNEKIDIHLDDLTRLGLLEEADIYHTHEFFSLYSGVIIKRILKSLSKKKVKIIYDSHELVPDPNEVKSNRIKKHMMSLLNGMLKEVDYVITVSQSIKSWFLSINPNLPVKVIYNAPPLYNDYKPRNYNKETFRIIHEGFVSNTRGNFQKIIDITETCNKRIDLRFKVIGGKRKTDPKMPIIPAQLLNKIELIDWIYYHDIPDEMKNGDVGWIDLDTTSSLNNMYAMPNKFFSYLNNGIPVLVNKCTDMYNFIKTHKCGLVVDNTTASATDYCEAIYYLYNNRDELKQMSLNARKVMENIYCWENMEIVLFSIYDQLNN